MTTHNSLDDLKKNISFSKIAKSGFFRRLENAKSRAQPDLHLHRSVLDRALLDMFYPVESVRKDVEEWLDLDNESFLFACERADVDPKKVYEVFILFKELFKDERIHDNS